MAAESYTKEFDHTIKEFRTGVKILANPKREGTALDTAAAKILVGGKSLVLAVIDINDDQSLSADLVPDVLRKINKSTEAFLTIPSMEDGMRLIASVLKDSDASITLSLVVKHPEKPTSVLLTGSTNLNPGLVVIDSITHKVINQKPEQRSNFRGVNYTTWRMHADRGYLLMGTGITQNFDTKEIQEVIMRAVGDKKEGGNIVDIQELTEYIALRAEQKIRTRRGSVRPYVNDITICAFDTPADLPVFEVPEDKKGFIGFVRSFFKGEIKGEDLQFSHLVNRVSESLSRALTETEKSEITKRLKTLKPSTKGLRLLHALLSNEDSSDIDSDMQSNEIRGWQIKNILNHNVMWDTISLMIDYKEEFHSALAVVLAEVPLGAIPERVREKLGDIPKTYDMEVLPWYGDWFLCDLFAGRLNRSLKNNGVIYVNGIPLKFAGKLSGVVLDTITDDEAKETILEGTIVSPVGKKQRDLIKAQFDKGVAKIEIPGLKLAVMRSWSKEADGKDWSKVVPTLRAHRENLPNLFPEKIGRMTRRDWRIENREDL